MHSITTRIDCQATLASEYRSPVPPVPKSVKIEISPRCNYRGGFCALRTREVQPKWDMDFGLFKRITREMRAAGVEEVGAFYLGESFMNPRLLVDCITWLKREIAMPYVFLTSNASMSFPEAVEACMKAGLDSLKWSVNAAEEAQFESIMGVSGRRFWRALENIKAAWEVRTRGGSAPCGSRCRAGPRSPRGMSPPKASSRRAASTPLPTGRWAISTGSPSWRPGTPSRSSGCARPTCARTSAARCAKSASPISGLKNPTNKF